MINSSLSRIKPPQPPMQREQGSREADDGLLYGLSSSLDDDLRGMQRDRMDRAHFRFVMAIWAVISIALLCVPFL